MTPTLSELRALPIQGQALAARIDTLRERSSRISRHAFISAVMLLLAALIDYLLWEQPKFVVAILLAWATLRLIVLSRSLADPTVLMTAFAGLYCAVPLIIAKPLTQETFYLPTAGAAWIYVVGTTGLLLGVALGNTALTPIARGSVKSVSLAWTGALASLLSVALSLAFAVKYGLVGADFSYAESFTVRAQTGVGMLMLSVPLAGAAACATVCSGYRLNLRRFAVCVLPYVLLYVVHGQRKYLLFPLIFIAAAKLQVRSMRRLVLVILAASAGFYFFQFLGYSRTLDISFAQATSEHAISGFIDAQGDAMGGEAVPVFATAAAAHEEALAPLPYAGDYLLAPTMALPQFLMGRVFFPLNERFAFWWNPDRAADGAGWGFSFFGEAYLVGGFALVLFMSVLMPMFFRWVYVKGFGSATTGIFAAISLSMLPYVFWFQRNAFAYLFREFGYQVAVLLIVYVMAKCLRKLLAPTRRMNGVVIGGRVVSKRR
jgi:hypothetical protein